MIKFIPLQIPGTQSSVQFMFDQTLHAPEASSSRKQSRNPSASNTAHLNRSLPTFPSAANSSKRSRNPSGRGATPPRMRAKPSKIRGHRTGDIDESEFKLNQTVTFSMAGTNNGFDKDASLLESNCAAPLCVGNCAVCTFGPMQVYQYVSLRSKSLRRGSALTSEEFQVINDTINVAYKPENNCVIGIS